MKLIDADRLKHSFCAGCSDASCNGSCPIMEKIDGMPIERPGVIVLSKLKNCPRCGGNAVMERLSGMSGRVICAKCGISTVLVYQDGDDWPSLEEQLVRIWNTKVIGQPIDDDDMNEFNWF